ncbi:MAG: hypothetical protein M3R00_05815, partial [Pseudomonadota bacterium]|nr:hypothetical protein [Pseudomonadota bacterium]
MKSTQWLVLASSAQSLIYEVAEHDYKLIKSLDHESSRLQSRELDADKEGKYQSVNSGRGQYS